MKWTAHAIFCDDIRREHNGKFILIGIYQGSLVTRGFPIAPQLATYVDIRGVPEGVHKFDIRAEYESDGETMDVATLTNHVDVTDGDLPTIIQGSGMDLAVEKPGTLKIWLSVDDDKSRLIDSLRVDMQGD